MIAPVPYPMRTKFATQTGMRSPLKGLTASRPSGMPRLSIVSSSAAVVPPRRHSSMNAATSPRLSATSAASGCSAATAMNVAP